MASLIQNVSLRLAKETSFTGQLNQDAEVFNYAIISILLKITSLGGTLLFALLLGVFKVTLIIWIAFKSLRIFTGGSHQHSPVTCWLMTISIFAGLGYFVTAISPWLANYTLLIISVGLIFSLFATITRAPATIPSKHFPPEKQRKLKKMAVCVLVFWAIYLLIQFPATINDPSLSLGITAGLLLQSISLLTGNTTREKEV